MKISIITISYNSDKTIERTIKSVIAQDFPNIEYIIIDGGSKDKTLSIIDRYSSKITHLISEPDGGISDAFNKGLALANGNLVAFLNADDWYADDKVLSIVANNYEDQQTILCGGINLVSEEGQVLKTILSRPEKLHQGMYITHPACFIPKLIIEKVGFFDVNHKIAMDFDYLSRCKVAGSQFKVVPGLLTQMQIGGASFNAKAAAKEELMVKNRYYGNKTSHYLHYYFALLIGAIRN